MVPSVKLTLMLIMLGKKISIRGVTRSPWRDSNCGTNLMLCDVARGRRDEKTNFQLQKNRKVNNLRVTITELENFPFMCCCMTSSEITGIYSADAVISTFNFLSQSVRFRATYRHLHLDSHGILNSVLSGRYHCQLKRALVIVIAL